MWIKKKAEMQSCIRILFFWGGDWLCGCRFHIEMWNVGETTPVFQWTRTTVPFWCFHFIQQR